MTKAEQRAFEAYPDYPTMDGGHVTQRRTRKVFVQGYKQAENDIISIIGIRLSEIIGDAQPAPILRAELEELINRIKDGKD